MSVRIDVVRVFVDADGKYGNELGIGRAEEVAEGDRQALAHRLGYSETIFVGPVVNGVAAARIFTPAVELPFAGHPTVGLAWWLAEQGTPVRALSVPAGEVAVAVADGITTVRARAEWAPEFITRQWENPKQVDVLEPAAFTESQHYQWAWIDEGRGMLRSRMFAPGMGVAEDQATGAAAVRITELLRRDLTIT